MGEATGIVLFDIDGTLLRGAGPHHREALIEGIRLVTGIRTTLDGVATAGTLDRDLITAMLQAAGYPNGKIRAALPDIVAACQFAYCENCAPHLQQFVCPGVREFLQQLQKRHAVLGLVTGNLSEIGWKKVELAGLREYFAVGAFSEDGHTRAELARIAAERARASCQNIQGCPVTLVGDHANDILAAKENQFRSLAVATGVSTVEELRKFLPDIIAPDLTSIDPAQLLVSPA